MVEKKSSTGKGRKVKPVSERAYDFAHELLSAEMENFAYDPQDFFESMGWDVNFDRDFIEKIKDEFDVPYEEYVKLARIVERLDKKGMDAGDIFESDEVQDFIANTMAREANRAIRTVKRKEREKKKPSTTKTATRKPSNKRK